MVRPIFSLLFMVPFSFAVAEGPKIAFITDTVNIGGYWGKNSILGARLAIAELRAEGTPIEVVFEEHGLNTAKAVSAAQKVIAVDGVDAVVCEFSPTCVAMSGTVLNAKKPFLYVAAATSILKSNPYAFKSFMDYERGCEAVARLWKSEGAEKIAHLKINIEAGEMCRNGLLKVFPEFLEESFDLNQDVTPQLLRFKQKGVDRLFCAGLEGDVLNVVQIFDRLHYFPHFGANEDADKALKSWQNPLGVKKGITWGLPKPAQSFVERLKAAFPGVEISHPQAAGLAYLHIRQLSRSLRGCEDVECQMKKLSESSPEGDFGFEGWDRDKRVAKFRVVLRQSRGGKMEEVGEERK